MTSTPQEEIRGAYEWAAAQFEPRTPRERRRATVRRSIWCNTPQRETLALAALVLGGVLALCALLRAVEISFLTSLAPEDGGGPALVTLWQVHSAVVGLSIPLLVLLMEQARAPGMLATSAGQAMVRAAIVVPTMVLAFGSVLEIGLVAIYLPSHGGLVVSVVVSIGVLGLIAHGYWRSLALLLSPARLRRKSEAVLVERLDRSIRRSFEEALASNRIAEVLKEWTPRPVTDRELKAGEWACVVAQVDCTVTEIDVVGLRELLASTVAPIAVGDPESDEDGAGETGVSWQHRFFESGAVLLTPIGQRVRRGDVIVAIAGRHPASVVDDLRALIMTVNNEE